MGQVWLNATDLSQDCVSVPSCTRRRRWLNNFIWTSYFFCCTELMHLRVNTSTSQLLHPLQICKLRLLAVGDRLSEQFRSRITPTDTPRNQYSLLNCFIPQRSLTYTVVTVASVAPLHTLSLVFGLSFHPQLSGTSSSCDTTSSLSNHH